VVVTNLDIKRIAIEPTETDPPLIVDTDRILPRSVRLKLFKAVTWWDTHIVQRMRRIQTRQFSPGAGNDVSWETTNPSA